jgi:hypothetical protein
MLSKYRDRFGRKPVSNTVIDPAQLLVQIALYNPAAKPITQHYKDFYELCSYAYGKYGQYNLSVTMNVWPYCTQCGHIFTTHTNRCVSQIRTIDGWHTVNKPHHNIQSSGYVITDEFGKVYSSQEVYDLLEYAQTYIRSFLKSRYYYTQRREWDVAHKFTWYTYYRHVRNLNERKQYYNAIDQEDYKVHVRAKRGPALLPDTYVDYQNSKVSTTGWKTQKKRKQWIKTNK